MRDREWVGPEGEIGAYVERESSRSLSGYQGQPNWIEEHANQEQAAARGGYARRQIVELVQNSADQIAKTGAGRIEIRLTASHLYCADNGAPIDLPGVRALLGSHLSPKHDTAEIGRFGVGFKSVLSVSDNPEVLSRSGSFRFDRERARQRLQAVAPEAARYPTLRVAEPLDAVECATWDPVLPDLMHWAYNIIRLPLRPGGRELLAEQFRDFSPESLLFVPHVEQLDLQAAEPELTRTLSFRRADSAYQLSDGQSTSRWMVFERIHQLSEGAREDSPWSLDGPSAVQIKWAAPLSRTSNLQHFWAFFPTQTASLVSGVLNAAWKTNEDRQNLLPGPYNGELIEAAAGLVAESLPALSSPDAPARHIDLLPKRGDRSDTVHASQLRDQLNHLLKDAPIFPDQNGVLRRIDQIQVPPEQATTGQRAEWQALRIWEAYAHRPAAWLHSDALTTDRYAALRRIFERLHSWQTGLHRARTAEWLEALVDSGIDHEDQVAASQHAVQIAAIMRADERASFDAGRVVLLENDGRGRLDPNEVYLGGERPERNVHPELVSDDDTARALKTFGIRYPTPESRLRELAAALSAVNERHAGADARWQQLWELARECDQLDALRSLDHAFRSRAKIRVRTKLSSWEPIYEVLLPGAIVSEGGDDAEYVVVDADFHQADLPLLADLGVVSKPRTGYPLTGRRWSGYLDRCQDRFQQAGPGRPRRSHLEFSRSSSVGPLDVFQYLADDSCARFTSALLDIPATFEIFTMRHATRRDAYADQQFPSPAVEALRSCGRVLIDGDSVPLAHALGPDPKSPAAQHWLLQHPNTRLIRRSFPDLQHDFSGEAEPLGDDEPVSIFDIWPGLGGLRGVRAGLSLIRCETIVDRNGISLPADCVARGNDLLVRRIEDERAELAAVIRELGVEVEPATFDSILRRDTPADVARNREQVRTLPTDAERLLAAVGEPALRRRLPASLVDLLDSEPQPFGGLRVAEAAIATFHTDALREYRVELGRFDPPHRWAGSTRALDFVSSLGFGPDWAGRRTPKSGPFIDVAGPRSLPNLHVYQHKAKEQVRSMLRREGPDADSRGLLSLPTGSGKTRVAVQAIIESIRAGELSGTVLWIADRKELCEQAVDAWRHAWASIGTEGRPLRISRWWEGQDAPEQLDGAHVVVATIQTVRARLERGAGARAVLDDVGLLVVDEAHGSIAPSYTRLLRELGLTFRRTEYEICLLGLSATPYRGRDETESRRLVDRYGRKRLDAGVFESDDAEAVVAFLQREAVLARADHETIRGGRFALTPQELAQIQAHNLPWLPDRLERLMSEDRSRTRGIVSAYLERVRARHGEVPTLIFATTVDHAKTIAAMLQLEGVQARAVSSQTEAFARLDAVEKFRSGEVKVLVNFGIFREGFDAPKTRAIIVARSVFSPNLYFQMIGRGLRGPRNGGSERCLILDVKDNIENYDRALAFTELAWLWERQVASV